MVESLVERCLMARDQDSRRKTSGGKHAWSVADKLTAASILATFVVSILSLALSNRTRGAVSDVRESRVEIDSLPSNSNAGDLGNPWTSWEEPVSPTTLYIGIKRRVEFKREFAAPPRVSTALGVINLYPVADRLQELGFKPPDGGSSSEPVPLSYESAKAPVAIRLKDLHVLSFATKADARGFVLHVGIGLPTTAAEFLASVLQTRDPPTDIVRGMLRYGQLPRGSEELTSDERWLVNFYTLVGSLNVTWTAQL